MLLLFQKNDSDNDEDFFEFLRYNRLIYSEVLPLFLFYFRFVCFGFWY